MSNTLISQHLCNGKKKIKNTILSSVNYPEFYLFIPTFVIILKNIDTSAHRVKPVLGGQWKPHLHGHSRQFFMHNRLVLVEFTLFCTGILLPYHMTMCYWVSTQACYCGIINEKKNRTYTIYILVYCINTEVLG